MADFEGHTPYTTTEPSGQPFASRHSMASAEGNGSLPPGHAVFSVHKRKGVNTPASFVKKVGG